MQISLSGPLNSLSYGYVTFNIAKALNNLGHRVNWFPIGGIDGAFITKQEDVNFIQKSINNCHRPDFEFLAPSLRIFHQNQLSQHSGKGLRIGFPFFELDEFDETEKLHLSNQDVLFVTSKWGKSIIEKNGIKTPTYIVPLGVDREIFNEDIVKQPKDNIYRFISIGKWEYRKGADFLVEAFNNAFEGDDKVELYLIPHNFFINKSQTEEWVNLYKTSKLKDKINIIPRVQTQLDIANFIAQCDCGIFPSRAEGWNLPLLECLSIGRQIITTNYSAHTEFCNKDNANLLDINELEQAYDGVFFTKDIGNWAKLDDKVMEQCISHMRKCYKERKQNLEGINTANKFTWENTANIIIESLRGII